MPTKMLAKGLAAPSRATPKRAVKLADEGIVTAIVAVTGVVDAVDDLIVPGAFAYTLKVRRPKVVDDHQWGHKAGRVLHVEEWMPGDPRLPKRTKDGKPWPAEAGALVATMQYNLDSERGRESFSWVRFYAASNEAEFSIGYKVPDGKARKRGDGVRIILMVDLYEFSHVLFGAAPLSMALDVKSTHGGSAGTIPDRPALTGEDDEDADTDYTDDAPSAKPWDDDEPETKTAAAAVLEAKSAGGTDRNRGNAEQLRQWFVTNPAIAWGTPGDFDRCVAIAAEHMTPDQAKGYCNLRHKDALGFYPATHAAMEGKTAAGEVKAMSRMKGSYEERIALLETAARDLFRTTMNLAPDDDVFVCPVATYATEAVFRVYHGNDEASYLVPYSAGPDGQVSLAEPERVELSLVAEQPDGTTEEVPAEVIAEQIDALRPQLEAKAARRAVLEAKGAPAPDTVEGEVQADENTITADNLPDGDWQTYRKTEPIEAMHMDGPFTVQTREGVVKSEGGWLATDSDGQPYPIADDEFENVYEPAEATGADPAEPASDVPAHDEVDDYADPEDGVEGPAEELEDETEEKVTLDPDEHFAMRESLDADGSEGDEED